MKKLRTLSPSSLKNLAVMLAVVAFYIPGMAQTNSRSVAREGDTVWVLVNHIKADKRQQFEKFINEIFWPMAKKLSRQEQLVFTHTRVLNPVRPETDGTYSYIFIMDPVIPGADYDIEHLLKKMYGEEKGAAYMRMFDDTVSGDQTAYQVIQSRY